MASGTELAKAYVQIVPSAQGIKGSIEQALGGEAEKAGESVGSTLASNIKAAVIAAGIGKALSVSIMEGADLQQSIGGIETLFKESADKMKNFAKEAYKTAGLSANEYMEQTTSFAASLLQSVGGNTKKAADYANRAVIDMSDNANKMGTSIQLIQNAYQGFAKQNYTMLDNLKLGYGGTKEEMKRLISDASKMTKIQKELNVTVKDGDMSFGNIINAISVMQKNLDITGTTSKEAAETFTGSFASMKASLSNFLGNLSLGEDIRPSLEALLTTTSTFVFGNLFPMLGNIFSQIPYLVTEFLPQMANKGMEMLLSFSKGFIASFPNLVSQGLNSLQDFANRLSEKVPIFIEKGFEVLSNLTQGIINALPEMIQKLPVIISTFANIINDNFPTILLKGAELLLQFIKGIISVIPILIANIPQIVQSIVDVIMAFNWLNLGSSIMDFFKDGIKGMVGTIKSVAKDIYNSIVNTIKNLPSTLKNLGKSAMNSLSQTISGLVGSVKVSALKIASGIESALRTLPSKMISIGKDLIKGLWNGISNMTGWIIDKIGGFANSVVKSIKNFFGIHSPSRVFNEEVGKMLPLGMAEGIENNIDPVKTAMNQLAKETVGVIDTDVNVSSSNLASIQADNAKALETIIYLLKLLVQKDENGEFVLKIGDREFARILKEMGVVFA